MKEISKSTYYAIEGLLRLGNECYRKEDEYEKAIKELLDTEDESMWIFEIMSNGKGAKELLKHLGIKAVDKKR